MSLSDEDWARTVRQVEDWLENGGTVLLTKSQSELVVSNIERGTTDPASRKKCLKHVELELSEIAGSPFYEDDDVEIHDTATPPVSQSSSSSTTESTLKPQTQTSVVSPTIYDRNRDWLQRNHLKLDQLQKSKVEQEMKDVTFRPRLQTDTQGVQSKVAQLIQGTPPPPSKPVRKPAQRTPVQTKKVVRSNKMPTRNKLPRKPSTKERRLIHSASLAAKGATAEALSPAQKLQQELDTIQSQTQYDRESLLDLYQKWRGAAGDAAFSVDAAVNKEQFTNLLGEFGVKNNVLSERVFSAMAKNFDVDSDSEEEPPSTEINFREFITGLATLSTGSLEELLRFCFVVYDSDGDGRISREELLQILSAALQDTHEDELLFVVMMVFNAYDVDGDGRISIEEFDRMCQEDPLLLNYIRCKFTNEPVDTTESTILRGAQQLKKQKEREERDFKFDPTSTASMGRFRLNNPEDFEIGTDYRRASGHKGISLLCARNNKTKDIGIIELRFDRSQWTEDQANDWWETNAHRFTRTWTQKDWQDYAQHQTMMR